MLRLNGFTLLEALVVLAIVAVTTAAAFGVLRRAPAAEAQEIAVQLDERVVQDRARAIRSGAPITRPDQALLPQAEMCSTGTATFFPDGSVSADVICVRSGGETQRFRLSPLSGVVEAIP